MKSQFYKLQHFTHKRLFYSYFLFDINDMYVFCIIVETKYFWKSENWGGFFIFLSSDGDSSFF